MRPRSTWGLIAASLGGCGSVLPSLIPRAALIQGLLLGACAAVGYGSAVLLGWLSHRDQRPSVPVLAGAFIAPAVALLVGWRWQVQLAGISGVPAPGPTWVAVALIAGTAVFLLILAAGRGIRWVAVVLSRRIERFAAPAVAKASAVSITAVVALLAVQSLPQTISAALTPLFSKANAATPAGVSAPTSDFVSGGLTSAIPWTALGSQGQQFVAAATAPSSLAAFSGRPASDPIRVFVGIDSSTSADERAALAVSELERFGAFQRPVIALGTSAGSGIIDPGEVVPLEYMFNGDVATVTTQYSLLPSFLSIMVDQQNSIEASRALIDAVRHRALQEPADSRPRLVVFGESLGAYGADGAFSDLEQLNAQVDGALFQGPPNSTRMWRTLSAQREPGSPQVRPVYGEGRHVRWANQARNLSEPPTAFNAPRTVYLQNASDPVVWWSPSLLWASPDWLREPRGPGVLPWLPWVPLFTFAGLTGDMINSQGVPSGHGHVYGTDPVVAWADILRPQGWTRADTARLQDHLS